MKHKARMSLQFMNELNIEGTFLIVWKIRFQKSLTGSFLDKSWVTDGVLIFLMTPDDALCAVMHFKIVISKKFWFGLKKGLFVI